MTTGSVFRFVASKISIQDFEE